MKKRALLSLSEKRAYVSRKKYIFFESGYFSDISVFAVILSDISDFEAILQALEKLRNPLYFL